MLQGMATVVSLPKTNSLKLRYAKMPTSAYFVVRPDIAARLCSNVHKIFVKSQLCICCQDGWVGSSHAHGHLWISPSLWQKLRFHSTCVSPLKSGFGTIDEREKKTFRPRICIWVENEQKKVKFALRSTKNPQKCQIFKNVQKLAQILREPSGNLRGPSGNRVHFSRTFGQASGNLRASFGEPSGGVKNILWPIFVKNFILWPWHFFWGGALAANFLIFFDFGKFLFFWRSCMWEVCAWSRRLATAVNVCVCIYIYICVCLCVFVEKMKQQSNKKEKSYYTFKGRGTWALTHSWIIKM